MVLVGSWSVQFSDVGVKATWEVANLLGQLSGSWAWNRYFEPGVAVQGRPRSLVSLQDHCLTRVLLNGQVLAPRAFRLLSGTPYVFLFIGRDHRLILTMVCGSRAAEGNNTRLAFLSGLPFGLPDRVRFLDSFNGFREVLPCGPLVSWVIASNRRI